MKSAAEVLARLRAIDEELPPSDGVKWFNRLYVEMTQAVAAEPHRRWSSPGFLEALDVAFASRYFTALDAAGTGRSLPADYPFHAWQPLFEARFGCDTCAARRTEPSDKSPEHTDYESVNGLIADIEEKMKAWMMTGLLRNWISISARLTTSSPSGTSNAPATPPGSGPK